MGAIAKTDKNTILEADKDKQSAFVIFLMYML